MQSGLQSSPYKSALFYMSILEIQQAQSWKGDHKFYELQILISKFWCINHKGQWWDATYNSKHRIAANLKSINVH